MSRPARTSRSGRLDKFRRPEARETALDPDAISAPNVYLRAVFFTYHPDGCAYYLMRDRKTGKWGFPVTLLTGTTVEKAFWTWLRPPGLVVPFPTLYQKTLCSINWEFNKAYRTTWAVPGLVSSPNVFRPDGEKRVHSLAELQAGPGDVDLVGDETALPQWDEALRRLVAERVGEKGI